MRKIIILMLTLVSLMGIPYGSICAASDVVDDTNFEENVITNDDNNNDSEEMSPAGDEIVGAVSKKDRRIAELYDKYNDKNLGKVAYYLEVVRFYSTPIFFIFLTIGAFNFFIIGNKKLDKKEQGFGWITACIIGWVFFQCIPLAFALFTL